MRKAAEWTISGSRQSGPATSSCPSLRGGKTRVGDTSNNVASMVRYDPFATLSSFIGFGEELMQEAKAKTAPVKERS